MSDANVVVRPYRVGDREHLLRLSGRLTTGMAAWVDERAATAAARGWVESSIGAIGEDAAVFVAVDGCYDKRCLGFVSTACKTHFTGVRQAYVGELVVDAAAEGAGVGRELMRAVEHWARNRGCRQITLETGAGNHGGRAFYNRLGFQEESITLTRVLATGVSPDDGQ